MVKKAPGTKTKHGVVRHRTFLTVGLGFVFSIALVLGGFLFAHDALAVSFRDVSGTLGLTSADLVDTVINIVRWALGLLGIVAVIFILYGGFIWLTSGGNEEKVQKAKLIIRNAVIGLVIVLLSWAITFFVIDLIGDITGDNDGNDGDNPNGGFPTFGVEWVSPKEGETNVPICRIVQVGFSDDVNAATLTENTFFVRVEGGDDAGQTCTEHQDCASGNCNAGTCQGDRLAVEKYVTDGPDAQLIPKAVEEDIWITNTQYRVTLTPEVKSMDNRGLRGQYSWTFSTGELDDDIPPTVLGDLTDEKRSPEGINVCLSAPVQAWFNEPMDVLSLKNDGALELAPTLAAGFTPKVPDVDKVDYKPKGNYTPFTTYEPTLKSDVIKDACGNFLDGDKDNAEFPDYPTAPVSNWVFTTNEDTQCEPVVDTVDPNTGLYDDTGTVRITGSNFGLFGDVIFNSSVKVSPQDVQCMNLANGFPGLGYDARECMGINDWDDNTITLQGIPASSGASSGAISGALAVEVAGERSNASEFWVNSPHIDRLSPEHGPIGQFITVKGTGFGTLQGQVHFVLRTQANHNTKVLATLPCATWSDTQIIIEAPAGFNVDDVVYVQVTRADFRRSNGRDFTYTNEPLGPGICKINPGCGLSGEATTLEGFRFGNSDGSNDRVDVNDTENNTDNWTDKEIRLTITDNIEEGSNEVVVVNEDLPSNAVDYISPCGGGIGCDGDPVTPMCEEGVSCPQGQLCDYTGSCTCVSAPSVLEGTVCENPATLFPSPNPKKNATGVCVNALVHATFNTDMNNSTLTNESNVVLEKCNQGDDFDATACAVLTGNSYTVTANAAGEGVTVTPAGSAFDTAFWYQVRLTTSVLSATGFPLSSEYDWHFKTSDSADFCVYDSVDIDPSRYTFKQAEEEKGFVGTPYDSKTCQLLRANPSEIWDWSLDPAGDLVVDDPVEGAVENQTQVTSLFSEGSTKLLADINTGAHGDAPITVNLYGCSQDADCDACGGGGDCVESIGKCAPQITRVDPLDGAPGNLVTVNGCYFGKYQTGVSSVYFTDNVLAPFPAFCGDVEDNWKDTQVVVEVPEAAGNGPLKLRSEYYDTDPAFEDTSADSFAVSNRDYPGLCAIDPERGPMLEPFTLAGIRFGVTQDRVEFDDGSQKRDAILSQWGDTLIKGQVPSDASESKHDVRVIQTGEQSNAVNFTVRGGGGEGDACGIINPVCTPLVSCNEGLTCDTSSCICVSEESPVFPPKVTRINPPDGATNVCTNALVEIEFDQVMRTSSLQENITLTRIHGEDCEEGLSFWDRARNTLFSWIIRSAQADHLSCPVETTLRIQQIGEEDARHTIVYIEPEKNLLSGDGSMNYQVDITSGTEGVLSEKGMPMGTDVQSQFGTGSQACRIADVKTYVSWKDVESGDLTEIESSTDVFTCALDICPEDIDPVGGNQHGYRSQAYAHDDYALGGIGYAWQSAGDIVAVAPKDTQSSKGTVQQKQGNETVTVTATGSEADDTMDDIINVTSTVCNKPWPTTPPFYYLDAETGWRTFYCMDGGQPESLVADQNNYAVTPNNNIDELLRDVLFIPQSGIGSIGVRIYENEGRLSPEAWAAKNLDIDASRNGARRDSYPQAVVSGTSYITATNLKESVPPKLYANMYVFDVSEEADATTQNIYQQMMANLFFNVNVSIDDKERISRDLDRVIALGDIGKYSLDYKEENESFVTLDAETFIPQNSTSRWSSWNATLGNALGHKLEEDPINEFSDQDTQCLVEQGYDPEGNCWNPAAKTFTCPADSHVLHYQYNTSKRTFNVFGNLEYDHPATGDWITGQYNPCNFGAPYNASMCSCYNYTAEYHEDGTHTYGDYTPL